MRELKAYRPRELVMQGRHNEPIYLKSEADKVIAELKDKCNMHDFFWDGCGFAKRGFKNSIAVSEAFEKLEAENKRLEKCCKEYDSRQRIDERIKFSAAKRLRHHKYKRCLAMAMYCHNQREIYERDSYDWELEYDAKDTLRNKANIMRKWRKRWLKLAEKFKPNSTAQQGKGEAKC